MPRYEYKVVPAPKKPGKIKGIKGTDNKFAAELAGLMNTYGAEGWEYQRTDTLPCEERQGLTGRTTTFQNMLVFRRSLEPEVANPLEPLQITADPSPGAPALSVPQFRSTVPAAAAPEIGPANTPEPGNAPSVAAQ